MSKSKTLFETDCKYCKVVDIRPCPIQEDHLSKGGKFNIQERCPWKEWFDNVDPYNFKRVYRL